MAGIQDYTQVVIGNRTGGTPRAGAPGGSTSKKGSGSAGISSKLDNSTAHKLDNNEVKPPETIGRDVGKHIATGRLAKGWKQDEFARQLALTKNVVTDLEAGTHKHDNKLLQKVENKLGIWLTGDVERLGQPKVKEFGKKDSKASPGKPKADAKKGKSTPTATKQRKENTKEAVAADTASDAPVKEDKADVGSDKENTSTV